jgi:DNA-binding NtrC family response regulator
MTITAPEDLEKDIRLYQELVASKRDSYQIAKRSIQAGYKANAMPNALEALKQWEEHGQRFDLLITDMVMPGKMNGLKLATKLKEMKSSLKVIIISGYSHEAANPRRPFTNIGAYLTKPIDHLTLLTTVRQSLNDGK